MGAVCASRRRGGDLRVKPPFWRRYDAATGEMIPVAQLLAFWTWLRVVSENAATEDEWRKYATHAGAVTYG